MTKLTMAAVPCALATVLAAGCADTYEYVPDGPNAVEMPEAAGARPVRGDAAQAAPAAARPAGTAPRATVDALPRDDARRAFDGQAAVASAAKPLSASRRPSAMPFLDATLPTATPSQVAAAELAPADAATAATTTPAVAPSQPAEQPAPAPVPAPTPVPAPPAPEPAAPAPAAEPAPAPAPVAPEPKPAEVAPPAPAAPKPAEEPKPAEPVKPAEAPAPAPVPPPAPAPAPEPSDGARVMPAQPAPAPEVPPEPSKPQRSRTDAPATPPVDEAALLRAGAPKAAPSPAAEPKAAEPASAPVPAPAAPEPKPVAPSPEPKPAAPAPEPAAPAPAPAQPAAPAPARAVRILRAAIASKVRGFGDLDAFYGAVQAGKQFVAYFELGGWTAPIGADGKHTVRAVYSLRLLDVQRNPVWTEGPIDAWASSRSEPRDLHIARVVRIPATLPAGAYVLEIEATDPATGASARADVRMQVGAPQP